MIVIESVMRRSLTVAVACMALACTTDLPPGASDVEVRAANGTAGGPTTGGASVGAAMPRAATRDPTLDVRIIVSGFARRMVAKWAIDALVNSYVVVNSTRFVSP